MLFDLYLLTSVSPSSVGIQENDRYNLILSITILSTILQQYRRNLNPTQQENIYIFIKYSHSTIILSNLVRYNSITARRPHLFYTR